MNRGLTLRRTLWLALVGLTITVALLFGVLLRRWGDSLLSVSERLRDAASRSAEAMVTGLLAGAGRSLRSVASEVRSGIIDVDDPLSVEKALLGQILGNADISEVTFTRAFASGDVSPWQVSVFRDPGHPPRIVTSRVRRVGRRFAVDERQRAAGETGLEAVPFASIEAEAQDPTLHLTFATTVAHDRFSKDALWTDLHYSQHDERLPEADRRVVVTVMRALKDEAGGLLGVVRVGLLARRLDEITGLRVDETDANDPHRIFLADGEGRMVTRMNPEQALEDQYGDLRPSTRDLPKEILAALEQPALREVSSEHRRRSGRFRVDGRTYLMSALFLTGAQGWRVGVVVPEDHYLGELRRARGLVMWVSFAALSIIVVLGAATLRSIHGSFGRMVASATRMRDFDFTPAPVVSPFRDVAQVMQDLELAKTALRAMGKYVPIGLVRQLYRAREEPVLGGELRDVTIMFTDIEGFTTVAERLEPDVLAAALGRYLETLTAAIHEAGGTVDKYIGDAVMALWNAPEPRADHTAEACAAALAGLETIATLVSSEEWSGLPPFRTRVGLHQAEVMVGHFGAPDRISYTALGDGVNLASRLEGLNKTYGTSVLVSQDVRDSVGRAFEFRLVDVVAVKGKSRSIRVYELLSRAGGVGVERAETVARYERALAAYQERRFVEALELLNVQPHDPPSRVLSERCERFLTAPPGDSWSGAHVALEK